MSDDAPSAALGFAWALAALIALLAGSVALSLWMGCTAGLAAAQLARTLKKRKPQPLAAAAAATLAVIGAGFGVLAFGAIAALALVGAALWASSDGSQPIVTVMCAILPVAAASPPVLLRATDGLVPALVLLVDVWAYDAAAFVMGAGAKVRWIGPLLGMCCIGSVTLAVAAIFPQFHGASAWELGVVAALLVPLGPILADRLLGNRAARVPALRRLDSLLVIGPVWTIAAVALIS